MARFLFVCVFSTLQDDPGHLSADRNQVCLDPHVTEHLEQVNERDEQIAEESTMVVVSGTIYPTDSNLSQSSSLALKFITVLTQWNYS